MNEQNVGEIHTDSSSLTVDYYTVSFSANGGENPPAEQFVLKGGKAVEPTAEQNPTLTGYTFAQWTVNGVAFDFETPIAQKTELSVAWTLMYQAIFRRGEYSRI